MEFMKILFVGYATVDIIEDNLALGGGAGIMSINAALLGIESSLLTVLSKDRYGQFYQTALREARVDVSMCNFDSPRLPTCNIDDPYALGSKRRWKDNGANKFIRNIKVSRRKLSRFDGVFIVNSHPDLAEKIAKLSPKNLFYIPGPQSVLQKNYVKGSVVKRSKIIFGNFEEKASILNEGPFDKGVEMVIITRGKSGGIIYFKDGKKYKFPPPKVKKVIDTTGAGDNFALGFGMKILEGKSIKEAIGFGKKLAKIIIEKRGGLLKD